MGQDEKGRPRLGDSPLAALAKTCHGLAREASRRRRMARCENQDQNGRNQELWRAAIRGGAARVEDLIDAGAKFDARCPVRDDPRDALGGDLSGATIIGPMERSALMGHADFLAGALRRGADPFAHLGDSSDPSGWRGLLDEESSWRFAALGHHQQMKWLELACSKPLSERGGEAVALWLQSEAGRERAACFGSQVWTCASALMSALEAGLLRENEEIGISADSEGVAFSALVGAVGLWESAARRRGGIQGAEDVLALAERLSKITNQQGWNAGQWWADAARCGRGPLAILAVSGMGEPPAWVECNALEQRGFSHLQGETSLINRWPLLCACVGHGSLELASMLESIPSLARALQEGEAVEGAALVWSRMETLRQARKLKDWGFDLAELDARCLASKWSSEPAVQRAFSRASFDRRGSDEALALGLLAMGPELGRMLVSAGQTCEEWLFKEFPECAAKAESKIVARAAGKSKTKRKTVSRL